MIQTFLSDWHNVIGTVGVAFVLFAYFMMQLGKMAHNGILFSGMNLIGSAFIMVSLYFDFNLASVIIEISWLFISLFGLTKAIFALRKTAESVKEERA